jgi:uncharacterized protein YkwD
MRALFIILFLACFTSQIQAQNEFEQTMIDLVNFVRTEPKKFLKEVVQPYLQENELQTNRFAKTLVRQLEMVKPVHPLIAQNDLMLMARSYADEAGKKGWTNHVQTNQRFKKFAPQFATTGENLHFGSSTPLDIVMSLLIDDNVQGVGHRKNILDPDYTHIGVAFGSHKTYDYIGVMTFGGE